MLAIFYRFLIELTNRKWTSLLLARFTKSESSRLLISSFSKVYKINEDEMEKPLEEYKSLHEFFIRSLKKNVRQIDKQVASVVSPVDAVIEDMGTITYDHTMIVKEKSYSITEMLGNKEKALKYQNGTYMIFYLSPSNYHRIHCPVSGKVTEQWTLGSNSYPVNKYGLKYGKSPLSKNYRTITEVSCLNSSIAIIKIGAMFVNSIELLNEGDHLEKGSEMAYFTFGSTVVLLFEEGKFQPDLSISLPWPIKVGELIGFMKS